MLKYPSSGVVTSPGALLTARRDSELPVIIEDEGVTWTWSDMARYAEAVAAALPGVEGRRVTVTAPNGGALVAAIFGVWLAGGVPAPLSYRLAPAERERVLETVEAAAHLIWADLALGSGIPIDAHTGVRNDLAPRPAPLVALTDPGIVLCTSGTTGRPKAIIHSYRAVWGMIDSVTRHVVDPDVLPEPKPAPPRRVEPKPLAHVGALFGLMYDLWRGRSMVVMSRFNPERYAELIITHEVALLSLAPSMVRMMLDSNVAHLSPPATFATTGTAALPVAWRDEFEARFGVPIQATYGQTESCGAIAYEPVADVLGGTRRPGTAGQVVPQVSVEIRADDLSVLETGSVGHIWVSGETLDPTVVGDTGQRMVDGWLDTGDVGWLDADRYIYLTGRDRELIIRGGLKVVPAEVENALLEFEAMIEVAVAGRPDERLGEVPVAWVRTRDTVIDEAEVIDFLRQRLTAYKLPVRIVQVDTFPRTDTGKIRKHALELTATPSEVMP